MERKLLPFPLNYGGMGTFVTPLKINTIDSRAVVASLIKLQLEQNSIYGVNTEKIKMLKTNIKLEKLRQDTKIKCNTMYITFNVLYFAIV